MSETKFVGFASLAGYQVASLREFAADLERGDDPAAVAERMRARIGYVEGQLKIQQDELNARSAASALHRSLTAPVRLFDPSLSRTG